MKKESQKTGAAKDDGIFSRPKEFRGNVVLEVWERAKPGKKANTRIDWRTKEEVGPWKPGQPRDGVWDIGHKEAWYKVVERLKRRKNVTRDDVIDEFNNIKNLGVEDPESNRSLGVNSQMVPEHSGEEFGIVPEIGEKSFAKEVQTERAARSNAPSRGR